MPIEKAIYHQIHQLADIKAFLVRKNLWHAYHGSFAHNAAELLNCLSETHPMYGDVRNAMVDLVESVSP